MSPKLKSVAMAACLCAALAPTEAFADAGDGIRTDSLKLELGLGLGTQLNTNLFFESEPTYPLIISGWVMPTIGLSTINTRTFKLDVNWQAGWQQYFSDTAVVQAQTGFSTALDAQAGINTEGAFSLVIDEKLQRTNEPPGTATTDVINRLNNDIGATLGIHPGGRVFQFYASYNWGKFTFNETFASLNKDEHNFRGRFLYKFFPKSLLHLTARYGLVFYEQPTQAVSGATLANNNSTPLRLTGGLSTLLLSNLMLDVTGGYGLTSYENGPSAQDILFDGQLRLLFGDQSRFLSLSYRRDFEDSAIGNYQLDNVVGLSLSWKAMDNRLSLDTGVDLNWRSYFLPESGDVSLGTGVVQLPEQVDDLLINGKLRLSYAFTNWLSLYGNYALNINVADSQNLPVVVRGSVQFAGRDYTQNIVSLGLNVRY